MKSKEIKKLLQNEVNKIEVPDVLDKVLSSNNDVFKDKNTIKANRKKPMKWVYASLASLLIILIVAFTIPFLAFDNTVFATISFDINPSIEFTINKNDQIIDLNSYNYDGENLILDISHERRKLEEVIENITTKLINQNFIKANNNFLYFTIDCSDNFAKEQLKTKIKNKLIQSCQKHQIVLEDGEIEFGEYVNQNGNNYGISTSKYIYLQNGWNEMTDKSEFSTFENFVNFMKNKSMAYIRNYIEDHK